VFNPAAPIDPQLATDLSALLVGSKQTRECLSSQLGRLAARNSCNSSWTSRLDARLDLFPVFPSRRLRLTVSTRNALSAVDYLIHGEGSLRGWGQGALPDRTLLRIRGFDPVSRAYLYQANPGFGTSTQSQRRFFRPFELLLEARVTIGADPVAQPLERLIEYTRGPGRSSDEIRGELNRRIPNLPAQILSLDSSLELGLTSDQRRLLSESAGEFGARLASVADLLAVAASRAESGQADASLAWKEVRDLTARVTNELTRELESLRLLLRPDQWDRLPRQVREPDRQFLPPSQPVFPQGAR
jgi:hypothetical protein